MALWSLSSVFCTSLVVLIVFFFKQKTAYEMRISDWSSDVCSSDLQRDYVLDRQDRHIKEVLAGIRNKHLQPPKQKAAVLASDIVAMIGTLDTGLVGLRDRAILLVGFAGGLRRSEIVGLDHGEGETEEGLGRPDFLDGGMVLPVRENGRAHI